MALEVQILFDIAILLIFAKIFGEIAERLKFSSLVGEIIAGITVGPILGLITPSGFLSQIAGLGAIFLMFHIGLSTKFDDFKKDAYMGSTLAILGALLSAAAGFAIGLFFFGSAEIAVVAAIVLASTSTAASLRSLIDIGEFKTSLYHKISMISTADDVIAVLAVSLLTTYITFGIVEIWKIAALFFAVLGFIFLIMTAGARAVSGFLNVFSELKDEHMMISIPLVIVFLVAFASEQLGIAGITGAFLAGMAMNKSHLTESLIQPKIKTIGYGFFIPLFFAYSTLVLDLAALVDNAAVIVLIVAAAALAKFAGSGLAGRFYRLDVREQMIIGVSMIPRGDYAIVVAQIALTAGILTSQVYTVLLSSVLVTIIIAPLLFRAVYRRR